MLLYRLVTALERHKVPYAIAGGYALALHGAIRGTVDIDLVIALKEKSFLAFESAMKELGFESRLPVSAREVFSFRREYIHNRNLLAWSFYNPKHPLEVVDALIGEDLAEMNPVRVKAGGYSLSVVSIPDLMRMKKKAGRPQDLADIQALESLLKGDDS